ncbi:DoxX family protein [Lacibacter sediminis]|uniref:DoxX family protein n=1 Tax=Lacibacter sediminis TaxID=2760713 RepID=A0A7G5XKB6_9BACT|nr:DoxX family protein [Lacibacter sediminis]QNA45919.1 DoxX family protein [Lacibacter sediminis]
MRSLLYHITAIYPAAESFHLVMFFCRIIITIEFVVVHGLKKIGIGVANAEVIPNPLHWPVFVNDYFILFASLVAPVFIIIGLYTRLAIMPVLAVTLTGYFIVHWNDSLLIKDVPFIYSMIYLLILVLGPGKYSADYFIHKKQAV